MGVGVNPVEVLAQVDPVLVVGGLTGEDPHAAHTGENGDVAGPGHRVTDDDGVVRQLVGQAADHVELGRIRDKAGVSVHRKISLAHISGHGPAPDQHDGQAHGQDGDGGPRPEHRSAHRGQANTSQGCAQRGAGPRSQRAEPRTQRIQGDHHEQHRQNGGHRLDAVGNPVEQAGERREHRDGGDGGQDEGHAEDPGHHQLPVAPPPQADRRAQEAQGRQRHLDPLDGPAAEVVQGDGDEELGGQVAPVQLGVPAEVVLLGTGQHDEGDERDHRQDGADPPGRGLSAPLAAPAPDPRVHRLAQEDAEQRPQEHCRR